MYGQVAAKLFLARKLFLNTFKYIYILIRVPIAAGLWNLIRLLEFYEIYGAISCNLGLLEQKLCFLFSYCLHLRRQE